MSRYRSVWELPPRPDKITDIDRARLAARPEFNSVEREERIQRVKRGGRHVSGTRRPVTLAKVNLE